MRTWLLLLAVAAAPVLVFASCSSGPASQSGTGGTTTSSTSTTATSTGSGGAGGTPLLTTGTGSFTVSGSGGGTCGTSDAGADAATGCDGLEGGVTFSGDVGPIFRANCSTSDICHTTPTYGDFVNVLAPECCNGTELFVKPGDADHSYVMNKITGYAMCYGSPMPFGGPALPDADILTIRRWICEGAPDN